MSAWQHFRAIVVLPFMVTIIIPIGLLLISSWTNHSWMFFYPFNFISLILGLITLILGYLILYKTVRAFARIGQGTLAPWAPTQHLVVMGLYRYLRNPMILGVLFVLLGEAILFGSTLIFLWFIVFFAMNHIWFVRWEEPDLERRFGEEYRKYKQNVPRWIPRRNPWNPNIPANDQTNND